MKKIILILLTFTLFFSEYTYSDDHNLTEEQIQNIKENADMGDDNAQQLTGFMYFFGVGVKQNYKESMKWFKLASDQGNANAKFMVGSMYSNGKGVKQDLNKAKEFFKDSCYGGYKYGCNEYRQLKENEIN